MSHNRQRYHSGPLPSCFRPIADAAADVNPSTPLPPPTSTATSNLSTSLYHTRLGIFTITWSRNLFGRSLRIQLLPDDISTNHSLHKTNHRSLSFPTPHSLFSAELSPSFHLILKPYIFWNKHGHKKLPISPTTATATVHWDFTHAKFGTGPDPESGYYIAILSPDGEIALLLGDMDRHAYAKITKPKKRSIINSRPPAPVLPSSTGRESSQQALVVRREHVHQGATTKLHRTKAQFGGKTRELSVECDEDSPDPRLVIKVDSEKVMLVRHLKWKFRGSERVEVDGCPIRISWDVYNWLFQAGGGKRSGDDDGSFAVFTFRFDERPVGGRDAVGVREERVFWSGDLTGLGTGKLMKKCMKKTKARSSSASSMSSASSSGCGSVLEWESVEENELKGGPTAFSLVVYASKS